MQTALINAQIANSAAQQNASIQALQQESGSITAQAAVIQAQAVLQEAIRAKHQSGCPSNQLRTYAIPKLDSDYFDEEKEF
ncbi:hypothetical protein [Pseudomonas fluorescens]|uniref:Uncharacterized protein n=1 Tax=Pseudomonas fluorescens TaxID=294 RepID=A0A0F4TPV0_PSEFL|nr:hypothetical protein [Pseudomonas fluorescens]KJZ46089.1 hypothetical protein VC35_13305 [Pseudomonas fluorescens]